MAIFPVILLVVAFAAAADFAGTARCRGLFLWNGKYASANASECEIRDSVRSGALQASAALHAYKANLEWENFWNISSRIQKWEGEAQMRGNFRYLDLAAEAVGDGEFFRANASTVLHTPDSLFFGELHLGGGTWGEIRSTWISDKPNGFLDTMRIGYRSEFLRKGLVVGTRFGRHTVNVEGNFFRSVRGPLDGDGYFLRDSSEFWMGKLRYVHRNGDAKWKMQAAYLSGNAHFYGLRKDGENIKRFAYLPVNADVLGANGGFSGRSWEWLCGGLYGHFRLPHRTERFWETLAPNRALGASLLQVLSFSLYKRNFRLYGEMEGGLIHSRVGRSFHFSPGMWHFAPRISGDFVYAQGDMDVFLTSETNKAFVFQKSQTELYRGEVYMAGAIAGTGFLLESPRRNFFTRLSLLQIVPFFLHKKLSKIDESGETSDVDFGNGEPSSANTSSRRKSEHLSPFKTGFGIDLSVGYRF